MSPQCLKLIIYITYISFAHAIIIFNHDKFIIDTPFDNIRRAVKSGNMKCDLVNEDLQLHQNKYNGTHIIFKYRQICHIKTNINPVYPTKEEIYFSETECGWKPKTPNFEFNDTCSIEYTTACKDEFLGPCVPSPENSTTSKTRIMSGGDIIEFTTEEIQSHLGRDVFCDPKRLPEETETIEHAYNKRYTILAYGKQMCVLKVYYVVRYIVGGVEVAPRFGTKVNNKPVQKNESFN